MWTGFNQSSLWQSQYRPRKQRLKSFPTLAKPNLASCGEVPTIFHFSKAKTPSHAKLQAILHFCIAKPGLGSMASCHYSDLKSQKWPHVHRFKLVFCLTKPNMDLCGQGFKSFSFLAKPILASSGRSKPFSLVQRQKALTCKGVSHVTLWQSQNGLVWRGPSHFALLQNPKALIFKSASHLTHGQSQKWFRVLRLKPYLFLAKPVMASCTLVRTTLHCGNAKKGLVGKGSSHVPLWKSQNGLVSRCPSHLQLLQS